MDPADLTNRFTYHPPTPGKIPGFETLRAEALRFAQDINNFCPDGREKSLAITHLEEVVFWANAAIARWSPKAATDSATGVDSATLVVNVAAGDGGRGADKA